MPESTLDIVAARSPANTRPQPPVGSDFMSFANCLRAIPCLWRALKPPQTSSRKRPSLFAIAESAMPSSESNDSVTSDARAFSHIPRWQTDRSRAVKYLCITTWSAPYLARNVTDTPISALQSVILSLGSNDRNDESNGAKGFSLPLS